MFYYFGYGSNLSVVSLRAKGVDPLTSEAAVLSGWRLVFDIPDFFTIEGGTGNIEPADGDVVHGVLHGCRSRDLAMLDQLEALGTRYQRVETTVVTYAGRTVRAYVYLGLESILDPTCRPSQRYKNILLRGAIDMNLDAGYLDRLRAIETCARPERGSFVPPPEATDIYTLEQLRASPSCTALGGRVFDMTNARDSHAYLRKLLGGRDATLLFLKRMDSSTGKEVIADVIEGRMTPEQRGYIDGYLHEFAREYRCIGTLDYGSEGIEEHLTLPTFMPRAPSVRAPSPVPISSHGAGQQGGHDSWRPPSSLSRPPSGIEIAARSVLSKGEAARLELGHENLGFLSSSHGYMPAELPRTQMPKGYEAWDQLAADLPDLYRTLKLRRAVAQLPVLRADEEHLPEDALLRAAVLLGMLSHAHEYVETLPPTAQPTALAAPWREVRARLGRTVGVLTYQDLIVYNWRLLDPHRPDPMSLDNMRLLVPTVDNDEERNFYLTQTQILAHTSPIVAAVVRAQEAVVTDDVEALESALMTIISCLQRVVRESLLFINPTPAAATYVDPVVWAKTVAPFAVPMIKNAQGPSGTSSPIFNTLDIFFGRKRYETFLGREIHALRDTYPPLWREFLGALQDISVSDYVQNRGRAHLRGLLNEARSIYAGPNGFLGRHRMKVYGYLELAFKVGRTVTIGGFRGMFKDRTWDQVDAELEKSRVERVQSFPQSCHYAKVKHQPPSEEQTAGGVFDVVLDVSGTGLRYEAGDRCGVLPENAPELVARTLAALGATGDEPVTLSGEWRAAIKLRHGFEHREELSLAELLTFGQIRPVHPRVAEALHARTQDDALEEAIRRGKTHHWELWDVLAMLRAGGFDPRSLLAPAPPRPSPDDTGSRPRFEMPAPSVVTEGASICEIVPPEHFRMYSISSVVSSAETDSAAELRLTVAPLAYDDRGVERRGVTSSFLASLAGRTAPISIIVDHPPRFALPRDGKTPLVMIAGGTGVSPFRGFLKERARQLAPAKTWLFLGVRSRSELVYADELADSVRAGKLVLAAAFSREDVELRWKEPEGIFEWGHGRRRYVTELLAEEDNARQLWDLLLPQSSGGGGACVYVCGRTRFAKAAVEALKAIFARFAPCPAGERDAYAQQRLRELAAEGRFMQEIFSGEAAVEDVASFDVSEIVRHNDEENGYWLLIDGRVYDVTEYVRLHPGGMRILHGYAGTDATEGYARAHHARTEIDATREMYVLGAVRALDLKGTTATVNAPTGMRVVSLAGAYRAWVKNLYLVVEMQNALRNDLSLQHSVTTRGDPASPRSLYKLQRSVETHGRFLRSYLEGLVSESFPHLWMLTQGLCTPDGDAGWMSARLAQISASNVARFVESIGPELHQDVDALIESEAPVDSPEYLRLLGACEVLELEAGRFLGDVKTTLREGVRVFEELERDSVTAGGERLVSACKRLSDAVHRYYGAAQLGLSQLGDWQPVLSSRALETDLVLTTQRILTCTKYWFVEELMGERVVVLRRTAIPFESLDVLVSENGQVISAVRHDHQTFGVVVDMRQAPARNDPAFEGAMRTLRDTVTERFARLAVLLDSTAGMLQVTRLGRGEGHRVFATMSESAAMKFAKGET